MCSPLPRSKCQQDQDKLREDIEFNQERDEYLERFCFPVEEEVTPEGWCHAYV